MEKHIEKMMEMMVEEKVVLTSIEAELKKLKEALKIKWGG